MFRLALLLSPSTRGEEKGGLGIRFYGLFNSLEVFNPAEFLKLSISRILSISSVLDLTFLAGALQVALVSMVCALGKWRMAAMVRLLETGNFSEITAEEASREKLAVQSIHRELREADEANLLEEEDMHVFDCKPLADPLHLVCCNACKRPIKASQYAAHAERCRSFNSTEETGLELDGGTGHKKPPRKGRKKLQTAQDNQAATVVEQERSESVHADDHAVSESTVDNQTGMNYSISREAKRHSVSIDGAAVIDGSGLSPRSTNYLAGVLSPSKRRTKLMEVEGLQPSGGLETAYGVTANMGRSCQEAQTCGEFSKGSIAGRGKPYDSAGYQKPGQVSKRRISTKDAPVPLATKVYNLQRNNHLRSALCHLYFEVSKNSSDSLSPKGVQGIMVLPSQDSSPKDSSHERIDDLLQKKDNTYALHAVRKPDQILAQSSELCLGNSSGHPAVTNFTNFSDQFLDNNFSRPGISIDAAPTGMMRGRYFPAPYSFPGNSGTSLGTMQQANGSVPVI
ncbi:uncharacterized protein LOC122669071 isoform X3 [Telopea speciosissima]|uniref:uncharacterized protein LOC122669071 isoform X3 n=2 Tax=Telopea speciosissima TaxID=54955 RepID=UPI001CC62BC9|nr:uncharacterized protein LOC122669071 isoform X3 [Telopea speciosissima]